MANFNINAFAGSNNRIDIENHSGEEIKDILVSFHGGAVKIPAIKNASNANAAMPIRGESSLAVSFRDSMNIERGDYTPAYMEGSTIQTVQISIEPGMKVNG